MSRTANLLAVALPSRDLGDDAALAQCGPAIADFAEKYADQNERDYAAFQAAVKDGRVQATTGYLGHRAKREQAGYCAVPFPPGPRTTRVSPC